MFIEATIAFAQHFLNKFLKAWQKLPTKHVRKASGRHLNGVGGGGGFANASCQQLGCFLCRQLLDKSSDRGVEAVPTNAPQQCLT